MAIPGGGSHLELAMAPFPLTPALSLWERGNPRLPPDRQGACGLAASREAFLLLPKGEARILGRQNKLTWLAGWLACGACHTPCMPLDSCGSLMKPGRG